ncbi:MAG: GHKL domain-containing protein, partial [Lachnospiraceae bacterium]
MGIEVVIDIPTDIGSFPMDPIDFTRILGIYLDNAIEAAKESKTPKLELHIADFGDRVVLL